MFDFHCHIKTPDSIFCTSKPLYNEVPTFGEPTITSIGLLPQFFTQENKYRLFNTILNSDIQIGEVGIDKRFSSSMSIAEQCIFLKETLNFAKENKKFTSIHCVRGTSLLLDILKETMINEKSVLIHGFTGSFDTLTLLNKYKPLISIGPSFFKTKYRNCLKDYFNNGTVVLETDYEGQDKNQYDTLLEQHYENCAKEIGISIYQLEEHCNELAEATANYCLSRKG
ncbi:MAG: TatD family hydrolase [Sphaerochaetaceae bacterium]|nr:TatD family hydrolase [Sphaerochaetaceae bacterium]